MKHEYLILGGGAIGLATAWELARQGAHVRVLDKSRPGTESSWAGGGILSTLLPWDYPEPVTALAERGQQGFPAFIDALKAHASTDPEYRQTGMLVLPPQDSRPAHYWREQQNVASPAAPAEITRKIDGAADGIWLPTIAQVRNPRLIQALLEALQHLGVEIHADTPVTRLVVERGQISAIEAGAKRWHADNYIITAGAWSAKLLGDIAPGVPIQPVRGQMLLYKSTPERLPTIIFQDGMYLIPRADGHILAGSTLEEAGFDKSTTPAAFEKLRAFTARHLPDVAAQDPVQHWAGLRPGSPGNIPIIDRHPELTNLYLNSGHFRYGVTMAPASIEILSNLINGRSQSLETAPYRWPNPGSLI